MKIGIFLTARLGSTRLERKHLREVNGRPIIAFLIERINAEFRMERQNGECDVLICSSDLPENRDFENVIGSNTTVFYGPDSNIPLRHLLCAKKNECSYILSVDGDDILCSTNGMRHVYDALCKGSAYVRTTGLPLGMNSCGYSKEFLETSLKNRSDTLLEIDWGRIFDENKMDVIPFDFKFQSDLLRLTLDYEQDYVFFKSIIEHFEDSITFVSDIEIVEFIMNNKLYLITEPIAKEYWENYYRLMEAEKERMKP